MSSKRIGIVTGASSGMGRDFIFEIVRSYPDLDEIWMVARREERMRKVANKIPMAARIFAMDLASGDYSLLEEELKKEAPEVKILINSSGFGRYGLFLEDDRKSQTDMVRVNCEALTAITHMVLPYMKSHGRIINMASSAAFLPQPKFTVYAATKAYVLSFTRALKTELADRNLKITAVCPGPVATEFFGNAEGSSKLWYKEMIMAKSKKVVKLAFKDCSKNKDLSVYGWSIRGFYVISKIFPHSLLLKIVGKLNSKDQV